MPVLPSYLIHSMYNYPLFNITVCKVKIFKHCGLYCIGVRVEVVSVSDL